MSITQEQYDHYVAQANQIILEEIQLDIIVEETIPIYTMKRPNPKSGQADCPITTREKEHFRYLMKAKLQAAKTDEERNKVIDHYKPLFEQ
jgi:hypothetical protein